MSHSDMSLNDYKSQVRDFSNRSDGELFLNSGPEYARVVMMELVNKAVESIDIYSGGLSPDVFDKSIFETLLRDRKIKPSNIRIVVSEQNVTDRNQELIEYLINLGVKVRSFADTDGHIAIVDESMYRFEYNTRTKQAMCAFGTKSRPPKQISIFLDTFGLIWGKSIAIEEEEIDPSPNFSHA